MDKFLEQKSPRLIQEKEETNKSLQQLNTLNY